MPQNGFYPCKKWDKEGSSIFFLPLNFIIPRERRRLRGCLHGSRKILEGGTTFRLFYMQKFRPKWSPSGEGKEEKLSAFSS